MFIFFFQAEDGIRDGHVTGVQTCALPILRHRHQQVLNLTIPEAYTYLRDRISALVSEYAIDYIKWDHNRSLVEPGTRSTGRPAAHAQTLAVYDLIDELKAAHPGLEIESCASGGGRIDLGMMAHADRIWGSDCNDHTERQLIESGTRLLLPQIGRESCRERE